ncbi:hypothetical protein Tco_1364189, partial [Tanacetum coccineum]
NLYLIQAAQTIPVNIENSDKCTGPSNLNGISVEIPTSKEIYRDSRRTPGSRQVSDLTWNLNDAIICSPNPTAPRSVWHRHKSGPSSSPFGDPRLTSLGTTSPRYIKQQAMYFPCLAQAAYNGSLVDKYGSDPANHPIYDDDL